MNQSKYIQSPFQYFLLAILFFLSSCVFAQGPPPGEIKLPNKYFKQRDTVLTQFPPKIIGDTLIKSQIEIFRGDSLISNSTYVRGKKISNISYYYPSGVIRQEDIYIEDTTFNKIYYQSGVLRTQRKYFFKKNQLLFDESVSYFEDGQLEGKSKRQGEGQGDIRWDSVWYNNGKLKSVSDKGRHKFWCENGQIRERFIGDKGKSIYEGFYCNGKKNGKFYFINKIFLCTGPFNEWYENGQMRSDKHYVETTEPQKCNIPTGTWTYWDDKGRVTKKERYKDGKLIETKEFLPNIEINTQ